MEAIKKLYFSKTLVSKQQVWTKKNNQHNLKKNMDINFWPTYLLKISLNFFSEKSMASTDPTYVWFDICPKFCSFFLKAFLSFRIVLFVEILYISGWIPLVPRSLSEQHTLRSLLIRSNPLLMSLSHSPWWWCHCARARPGGVTALDRSWLRYSVRGPVHSDPGLTRPRSGWQRPRGQGLPPSCPWPLDPESRESYDLDTMQHPKMASVRRDGAAVEECSLSGHCETLRRDWGVRTQSLPSVR